MAEHIAGHDAGSCLFGHVDGVCAGEALGIDAAEALAAAHRAPASEPDGRTGAHTDGKAAG
jgi:hypothetical protein